MDAVVYYKIFNPIASVVTVENADRSTRLLAATTLRNVLGTKNMAEILSERESISHAMQVSTCSAYTFEADNHKPCQLNVHEDVTIDNMFVSKITVLRAILNFDQVFPTQRGRGHMEHGKKTITFAHTVPQKATEEKC